MRNRITFDFESRSAANLKLVGAFKYSLHPSTQPTCLAFKKHGESRVYFLDFKMVNTSWKSLPEQLRNLWTEWILGGFQFSAHNAFYELCMYENILVKRLGWPSIPRRQYRCTAAKAAACALPRNLADAGLAMNLSIQKDPRGYQAMMATCKPTKQYVAWKKLDSTKHCWTRRQREKAHSMGWPKAPPMFLEPENDPDGVVWQTLYTYCKIDVRAEEALDDALPDLIPQEQEIWHLNQTLNWRGLRVDLPVIKKISGMMETEGKKLREELDEVTMGLVQKPGAIKSILEFLALDGIELPNLRAKTIEDTLKNRTDLDSDMVRLLEIRQALSKSSTKKYQSFINRAGDDGRVRDILMYHGSSTGRDTGTGVQPHNFPRGLLKVDKARPYAAIENILKCDKETLHLLYGPNLSILFSAVLRNMIIPSEGKEFFVADFSKIEVAVLWWLSSNGAGLKILREGKDPYIYQAVQNLKKTYEEIEIAVNAEEPWALDARQLGKAQILGCGFGMGWMKFQSTAWEQYRLKLSDEQSKAAVASYREANEAVPELWAKYEEAAIAAIEYPSKHVFAGKCKFVMKQGFLWVYLPSGRPLAYRDPSIAWRVRQYEVKETVLDKHDEPVLDENGEAKFTMRTVITQSQKTIEFWAVNSKTKKWQQERTWGGTICENLVQATARDLMMRSSVNLEKAGYHFVLAVHDEAITEKVIGEGSIEEFVDIMTDPPKWAEGLPLEAKGWQGPRYRK